MRMVRNSKYTVCAAAAILAIMILGSVASVHASFGPATDLGVGREPHCALGLNGIFHIVFIDTHVRYMKLGDGVPSAVQTLPGSSGGRNPFIAVGVDGSVHVVWDTWSTAYYTNRVGGTWKNPLTLPISYPERNYFAQVAVTPDGTAYTSHWSLTKGEGGHNVFCRVTNTGSSTPTITKIYQEGSDSRPPSVITTSPASPGDGQIHIFIGLPQTRHRVMNSSGGVGSGTNISRTPYEKTVEGMQGFFIGNDPAIATAWWDRVNDGAVVNSLSRANAGKQGLIVGTGSPEFPFPRAAYCPIRNKAYILYPRHNRPALASWVPQQDTIQQLGNVTESSLSSGTRGCGAGGIARREGGGVHIVYSTGGRLYHRTMDAFIDNEPPSVPTNVQATSWGSTVIEVTWTASTDNVGVTGYKVFRNGNQVGTSTGTVYVDTGLAPSTTYSYTVSAYDAEGNESAQSSPSAVGTTLAPDSEPPSIPTNVQASGVSGSAIQVNWTASTDNRGVLGYKVFRNGAQVGTTSTTTYTDGGLLASTSYSYTVSAFDGDGNESAQSAPPAVGTTLTTIEISNLVPSNYVFTTFDVGSHTFIDRTFAITSMPAQYRGLRGIRTANDDKDKTNLDFRFNINQPLDVFVCLQDPQQPNTPLLTGFVNTGHTLETSDVGTKIYRIFRKTYPAGQVSLGPKPGAGDGKSMYFVLFDYPEDAQPPTVPTDVEATSITETSVTLGWTPSVDNVGVAGYKIFRNGSLAGTSGTNSYLDTGLEPITTYSYTVSAFDAAGNESEQSSPATVVTTLADTEAPSVPTGVSAEALSPTEVQVNWAASTDNIGVAGYRIFRHGVAIGTSPTPGYLDDEVVSGVSYSYKVSAYDAAGNESAQSSPPAVVTTPDNVPPSVPTNITATALSAVSIEIIWNASTDNVGVEGYKIFRDGELVGTTDDTSYTDSGLEPETTYSYTVSAYDAVGNESEQSSPAVATTQSAVSISEAKLLRDLAPVTLVSKIVSAVFDDFFYVKEPDDYVGIRVVPTEMPEGLSVKKTVDITGVILTSVMSDERYIDGDVMIKY